jgi:hypothetical protein
MTMGCEIYLLITHWVQFRVVVSERGRDMQRGCNVRGVVKPVIRMHSQGIWLIITYRYIVCSIRCGHALSFCRIYSSCILVKISMKVIRSFSVNPKCNVEGSIEECCTAITNGEEIIAI